jgi:hypothetical protein
MSNRRAPSLTSFTYHQKRSAPNQAAIDQYLAQLAEDEAHALEASMPEPEAAVALPEEAREPLEWTSTPPLPYDVRDYMIVNQVSSHQLASEQFSATTELEALSKQRKVHGNEIELL